MRSVAKHIVVDLMPGQVGPDEAVVALVWATVDLQRTIDEADAPCVPSERDGILGGRAARLRYGALDLLIEEPDTEARLAAYLARFGEGVVACYVEVGRSARVSPVSRSQERSRATPLGRPGWLRRHDFPWGPFVIAIEAA